MCREALRECVDRRSMARGQRCIRVRDCKRRGTAVQMMDRTGALERDEEEEEEKEERGTF